MPSKLKPDEICEQGENGHYFEMTFVLHPGQRYRTTCSRCGVPIKVRGARWVTDVYMIYEEPLLEDLL